ncbi:MAG: DNA-3-methyladenine glycosylase [Clostridiales bacterium]|nr:DNA-3-methyladenine glycosylase [Clostridiales bacterium]
MFISGQNSFEIGQILECGQCFRFEKIEEGHYKIIARNRVLYIKQDEEKICLYPCSAEEFGNIWHDYFDLGTDYDEIKATLSEDSVLRDAIAFGSGIRLLNQDPFECLISFIISQNNRIPMIQKVIGNISAKWGEKTGEDFLFPTLEALKVADCESLNECKTGFRSKYIRDCLDRLSSGEISLNNIKAMDTAEAKAELMKIKGVGTKVADCVLLFSLRRREVFPTDVWIKRVMEYFYFDGKEAPIKEIHGFAAEKWGRYAGFAQQYLFYYARTLQINAGSSKENKNKRKNEKNKA